MKRPSAQSSAALFVVTAVLVAGVWAIADLGIDLSTIVDSVHNAIDFGSRMFPLDFPSIGELAALTGKTLAIVLCATLLSVLLSIPVAVLAAGNTSRSASTRFGARALIVAARAVPDVVLAIVFFRVFGFGALAGVLAMGIHSVGMVAKLYADAIEQIDEGPRSAVRATGAGRWQELVSGVLPQVVPAFVATGLHRFDINLRISVLLGFVGVDGIGLAMATAFRRLDYQRGMALALTVLLVCVLVELLSGMVRRGLLAAADSGGGGRVRPGQVSPPWTTRRVRRTVYAGVTALVVLAAIWEADLSFGQFFGSLGDLGQTIGLFWPPETGGIFGLLLADLLVTVKIALAATVIGAVLAFVCGSLAASNVAPTPGVRQLFRNIIVTVRGMPELVLAIVFVVITGLGPVAGALALAIGTIGLLGKLTADSLEEVDPEVEHAVRATGAGPWQVYFAATLPQAAPAFVGNLLYQLDVNIRAATLLGIVGAGGIGFHLLNATRVLEFGVVTTVMILVFGTVLLVELLALWMRRIVR
ncbi:phosphonate ABC transporter, permease protein PhnE [Nocardia mangyaensis]|uniref:phosphonate ABC transporter, permease protein PhnE n=1 Tax=Nocardia mangyaensis TaxID=2213200 RepID=UPI0026763E7C|nr:phosphonate ABC transporter, permease protein PhnE [Nocardia mangyaensis]MDO3649851.1 phosphonate ABC transporter, permease protein PhnE [Nocardia mangyaensis]